MRKFIAILFTAICCGSCSMQQPKAPATAQLPPADLRGPIISRIHQREKVIAIRAGAVEPTYSLETKGGEILIGDMTLGELALKQPEMFQKVQTMHSSLVWAGD